MAKKGQFKKGGGRVGDARAKYAKRSSYVTGSSAARPRGGALVVVDQYAMASRRAASAPRRRKSSRPPVQAHRPRRRRHGGGSGGHVGWKKLAIVSVALTNVAGTNSGVLGARVYDLVQKIPGAKTLGGAAVAGLTLGALEKYGKIGGRTLAPWMRAAGIVGLILAASKVGEAGTKFAWLGDPRPGGGPVRGMDGFDVDTD